MNITDRLLNFLDRVIGPVFDFCEDHLEPHFNWDYPKGYDSLGCFLVSVLISFFLAEPYGIVCSVCVSLVAAISLKFLVGWIRHLYLDMELDSFYLDLENKES